MKPTVNSTTHRRLRTLIPLQWTEATAVSVAVRQVQSRERQRGEGTECAPGFPPAFAAPGPVLSAQSRRTQVEAPITHVSRLYRIWRQPNERTILQIETATSG